MKTYSSKSNAQRAARKELGGDAVVGADFRIVPKGAAFTWEVIGAKTTKDTVMLATEDGDLGVVSRAEAQARAQEEAKKAGVTVFIRDQTTDEVIGQAEPKAKGKSKSEPKAAKPAKAPKEPREKTPSGMVAKIIELALRPKGVTPAELNALTEWKGAPWKWLFSNPKGTGYADRWGYDFEAVKDGRAASYKLTAKATEKIAA